MRDSNAWSIASQAETLPLCVVLVSISNLILNKLKFSVTVEPSVAESINDKQINFINFMYHYFSTLKIFQLAETKIAWLVSFLR